ncbi:hypothetical protein glysoja_035797, partial [Glycine soja]
SNIYREGNQCADSSTNYGVDHRYTWWDSIPTFIRFCFFHNLCGLPLYRF